jgi:anti-sigma-K factor RskA
MSAELDCGNDAAAFVLGALDDAEAGAFRRHLKTCAACRDEVEVLTGTVDALALTVAQFQPPASLRRRVMAEVSADAGARTESGSVRRRGLGWSVPRPALAGGLLGVVAAAALVVGLSLGSGGTRVVRATVSWHGGAALVKVNGGRGELVVRGMPAPPAGHIYEVWLKRGTSAPAPTAALFDVTPSGQATVDVPGNLHGVTAVLVTPEPAGGTRTPTAPPVIVANLA